MENVFKTYTEKELEEDFVKYFGEDELSRQKRLAVLQNYALYIANKYLNITVPPVVFDETITSDAKYDPILDAIFISNELSNDFFTSLKAITHELKHYHQHHYIKNNSDKQSIKWKSEFDNYQDETNLEKYLNQDIELDAYAFTQYVLKEETGAVIVVESKTSQAKIETIKQKYKF